MNRSPFIQLEFSGACTSPFLDTDKLKMALLARKVTVGFEERTPNPKGQYELLFA